MPIAPTSTKTADPTNEAQVKAELEKIPGVEDIEEYCLVNNFGCYFKKGNRKFDIRRWANLYGCDLKWGISEIRKKEDSDFKGGTNLTFKRVLQMVQEA